MSEPTPTTEIPDGTYTLTELHQGIQRALRREIGANVWIVGEISSKKSTNGNVYIDLVERREGTKQVQAQLKVVCLRSDTDHIRRACTRARITITEGVEVRIRGKLLTYPPSGTLQLQMDDIDASWTLGRLVANKDELRKKLAAEGLLAANKQHTVDEVPLKVALVTSSGSAASEDFLDELRKSGYAWQVLLLDTRVQGERGPASVAAALQKINGRVAGSWTPDVVALVRGGGSRSDLATFDTEEVVRAIAGSKYPVITGIGHEIDSSLADEAANNSFKTPTACAQGLVGRVRRYLEKLDTISLRLEHTSIREVERAAERLESTTRTILRVGEGRLERAENALQNATERLERSSAAQLSREGEQLERRNEQLQRSSEALQREDEHLEVAERVLAGYDPKKLLERGWAIVRSDGKIVTDPTQVKPGDPLVIQVHAGTIHAETKQTETGADDE